MTDLPDSRYHCAERRAFEIYLRTGRRISAQQIETKFNPWHDPEDGRFTFEGRGNYFPRLGLAGRAERLSRSTGRSDAPKADSSRMDREDSFRGGGGSFGEEEHHPAIPLRKYKAATERLVRAEQGVHRQPCRQILSPRGPREAY